VFRPGIVDDLVGAQGAHQSQGHNARAATRRWREHRSGGRFARRRCRRCRRRRKSMPGRRVSRRPHAGMPG
jgi:hypothetical protein